MSSARYAIYYVPPKDSSFLKLGQSWLGVDIETGAPVPHGKIDGLSKKQIETLTASSRYYGFHGTLKPPFELAPSESLEGMLRAARIYAQGVAPTVIPPLEIAVIGKFLALTPMESSAALESMASGLVRSLEAYRRHRTAKELAQYRLSKLTVHQEQMLEHWGYPYVLEEFRFHMTLTDRIDDDSERISVINALENAWAEFLGQPIPINEIAICTQPEMDTCMRIVERIPLGVKT